MGLGHCDEDNLYAKENEIKTFIQSLDDDTLYSSGEIRKIVYDIEDYHNEKGE